MKKYYNTLIIIIFLLCNTFLQASTPKPLILGIYAYLPKTIIQEQYQPLVDYLNNAMKTSNQLHTIKLRILTLDEIDQALANNQLDFLFTNPRHYNILRHQYKFTGAIATLLKKNSNGDVLQELGGVIFTRNSNTQINQLKDIKGHKIAVSSTQNMGGYQAQAYELLKINIEIKKETHIIEVGSHQKVVDAVFSGIAEVGFIRTEVLENMYQNKQYSQNDFKIINRQKFDDFPFVSSTELYPEWPFIALPQVDTKIVSSMITALLALNESKLKSDQTGIAGFVAPADYLCIDEMSRELRLSPHEHVTNFTLLDIWHEYKHIITIILSLALMNATLLLLLFRRNKLIVKQKRSLRKQSEKIHDIIDATQTGTWTWNIQTGHTIFNEYWAKLIGYTLAELSPMTLNTWSQLTHPDDLIITEEKLKEHFSGKTAFYEADFRMKHKEGHWVWFNDRGKVTQWSQEGEPICMSGTHTDISERKEFERQISRAHHLIEQSLNEIYLFDVSTFYFIDANRSAQNNLGYSMEELLTLTPYDIKPELSKEEFLTLIKPLQDGTQDKLIFTSIHQRKDGSQYPVEVHLQLCIDEQSVYIAMIHDITQRLQKEYQLRELNERVSKIASRIPGFIYQFLMRNDGTSCFPYASDKIMDIYHISPDEVKEDASKAFEILHPDDYKRVVLSIQESARTLEPWKLEYRIKFPDNTVHWLYGNAIPERDNNGNTIWNGFITDITEKRIAQDRMRLLASVFSNSQEGIIISDKDNRIIDVNPACVDITGYPKEELIGQLPAILNSGKQSEHFYDQIHQTLRNVGHWNGELSHIKKSGEP
ncbi:MAG: PAS domain S-box protein, partial [Gammaproteobacteria bacterium]|nr:PAS domain S-box protein [Gammaproteobacteria bacterium]